MRVAILGYGAHAQRVIVPVLQLLGAEIVAACDPREEARLAAAHRTRAAPFSTVDELLEGPKFDAAVIAATPSAHSDLLMKLIPIGRPLFVEKPAGHSAGAIAHTAALARHHAAKVQVGFMRRFAPAYEQAREISREWRVPLVMHGRFIIAPYSTDVGFIKDAAIHHFDLVRFVLGDVARVHVEACPSTGEGPRAWLALLTCEFGQAGLLLSHRGTWGNPTESCWIEGVGQSLHIDNIVSLQYFRRGRERPSDDMAKAFAATAVLSWTPNFVSTGLVHQSLYLQGYVREFQAFFRTVEFSAPVAVTLDDAHAAMEIAEHVLMLERDRLAGATEDPTRGEFRGARLRG